MPQAVVPTAGQSIDLRRRSQSARNETEWAQWARSKRDAVIAKYGLQPKAKRASGQNLYVSRLVPVMPLTCCSVSWTKAMTPRESIWTRRELT